MRFIVQMVVFVLLAWNSGCTVYVSRAEDAYTDGRYLEVAEELAHREPELPKLNQAEKARYGLYRGLSLLKLGEIDGAQRWLDYSRQVEATTRKMDPRQRKQLQLGLAAVQRFRVAPRPNTSVSASPPGVVVIQEQERERVPAFPAPELKERPQTQ